MVPMMRSLLSVPSIWLLLSWESSPLIEKELDRRRSSGRAPLDRPSTVAASLAPGVRMTSEVRLRWAVGRFSTAAVVMVVVTLTLSAWSSGDCDVTSTTWPASPTLSLASARAWSPPLTLISATRKALKPLAVTETE